MLKFLAKIAAQHALSPAFVRPAYSFVQQHVTRSITPQPQTVRQKVEVGLMYLDRIESAGLPSLLTAGPILDYGAGAFLGLPLLYARLGAKAQIAVDVTRSARENIVFEVARETNRIDLGPRASRLLPDPSGGTLDEYLKTLGIRYAAPVGLPLPLASESVSTAVCTQVLYYPPRESVREIFAEIARLLRPRGVFVASTHLYDTYWSFDLSLSRFNFLRYSKRTWERWFNSALIGYNRLRARDFRDLLKGLPLEPIVWEATPPTEDDLQSLRQIEVHPEFAGYDLTDLASTELFFVLQKR
jgi:SAM-dependent methyltransferase